MSTGGGGGGGASPLNTPAKFPEGKVHIYDSYGALRHNFGYPSLEPPPKLKILDIILIR